MTEVNVQLVRLPHAQGLPLPEYATEGSAGMDIYAANAAPITLKPFERCLIPTGFKLALPIGTELQIRPRSGLALKNGISVLNSPGTIDCDFRGEVQIILINLSQEDFVIERGMRIAQAVLAKYQRAALQELTDLPMSSRGEGGFGHTGIK